MKKLLLLVIGTAFMLYTASDAFAQLGVEVGYSNSKYFTNNDNSDDGNMLNGLNVGFTYDIRLIEGLSIQPGLIYSFVTDSETDEFVGLNLKTTNSEHYLNIPVRIQYSFDLLPILSLKVFTGPTFSFGLAGYYNSKLNGSVLGTDINGNLKYDYFSGKISSDGLSEEMVNNINSRMPDAMYNRFDIQYGLGVGVGLFDNIEVRAGYDFGLIGRLADKDADPNPKRNSFYVTLGFRF